MVRLELELARMIAQLGCPRSSTEGSFSREGGGNSSDSYTEADVSVSVEIVFAAAVEALVSRVAAAVDRVAGPVCTVLVRQDADLTGGHVDRHVAHRVPLR